MEENIKPSELEIEFLTLAYNRFYEIYEEVMKEGFIEKDKWYRFSKINNGFAIYSELLNYEPLKWVVEKLKVIRPPMEAEIGSDLFKFFRNVLTHFPFYDSWDEVWITKSLVNWYKEGQSIIKFIKKYQGHKEVKYRIWEETKKKMTYLTINFPPCKDDKTKIYFKDILDESSGIKFSFILMKNILDTQVEEIKYK